MVGTCTKETPRSQVAAAKPEMCIRDRLEAGLEELRRGNLLAEEGAELAFLELEGAGEARNKAGLLGGVVDGSGVRGDLGRLGAVVLRGAVEDDEFAVGIDFLGVKDRLGEGVARGDDHAEARVVEVRDLLQEARGGLVGRDEVLGLDAEILGRAGDTRPGRLVEGLVVDRLGVADHADLERGLIGGLLRGRLGLRRGIGGGRGGFASLLGAAAGQHGHADTDCQDCCKNLFHLFSSLKRLLFKQTA